MNQTSLLVRKEDIQELLGKLIKDEGEIVADLKVLLQYTKHEAIKKTLERRLVKGEEALKALHQGFVPVDTGYFVRTDTKEKWNRRDVKTVLDSMPPEVKEVWEKVKEKGIFKSFGVTTGGGDPILVGNTGGKHFFIAGWLNLSRKITLGVRIRI